MTINPPVKIVPGRFYGYPFGEAVDIALSDRFPAGMKSARPGQPSTDSHPPGETRMTGITAQQLKLMTHLLADLGDLTYRRREIVDMAPPSVLEENVTFRIGTSRGNVTLAVPPPLSNEILMMLTNAIDEKIKTIRETLAAMGFVETEENVPPAAPNGLTAAGTALKGILMNAAAGDQVIAGGVAGDSGKLVSF